MLLKCGKYITLISSKILYTFVVHAEIATIFGPNVVALSACNTKVNKICKLCKTIFSAFYNISQPIFLIGLLIHFGGGGCPGRAVTPPPTHPEIILKSFPPNPQHLFLIRLYLLWLPCLYMHDKQFTNLKNICG